MRKLSSLIFFLLFHKRSLFIKAKILSVIDTASSSTSLEMFTSTGYGSSQVSNLFVKYPWELSNNYIKNFYKFKYIEMCLSFIN